MYADPEIPSRAGPDRRASERAESLTARCEVLWRGASAILGGAGGRPTLQLASIRELRQVVELTNADASVERNTPLVSDLLSDETPFPSLPRGRTMPLPGQIGTSVSRTPCPHLGMIETRLLAGVIYSERAPGPPGATFRARDTPGTRCGAGRRSSS
jgi:hypothetical protein